MSTNELKGSTDYSIHTEVVNPPSLYNGSSRSKELTNQSGQ
jgi:hypothetical protein